MCAPLIVLAVVAVASAAASMYVQSQQAHMQNEVYKANANNARTAQLNADQAAGLDATSRYMAATQDATNNALAAARARAAASNAAGQSGLAGATVDSVVNDVTRQENANLGVLNINQGIAAEQTALGLQSDQLRAQSQILSAQRGYFNPYIGLLQVGAAGVNAYEEGKLQQ